MNHWDNNYIVTKRSRIDCLREILSSIGITMKRIKGLKYQRRFPSIVIQYTYTEGGLYRRLIALRALDEISPHPGDIRHMVYYLAKGGPISATQRSSLETKVSQDKLWPSLFREGLIEMTAKSSSGRIGSVLSSISCSRQSPATLVLDRWVTWPNIRVTCYLLSRWAGVLMVR